jgi:hypothetical protein
MPIHFSVYHICKASFVHTSIESTQEGDDVYFECGIVSNPPVSKLEWYHEVRVLGAERRGRYKDGEGRDGERKEEAR